MYGIQGSSDPLPLEPDEPPSREKPRRGSRAGGGKGTPAAKNNKKTPFQAGTRDEFKVSVGGLNVFSSVEKDWLWHKT